ncbi:MAG: DUF4382 domain-containing protein [Bacteroidetes bacterium]|nr:DUF4382 domain-containing protein [Bacteroidota bacterium]
MKKLILLLTTGVIVAMVSCMKTATTEQNGGKANINVHLTDAPGLFDKVNIDIKDVQVKLTADGSDSGWQSINLVRPGVYNLLDYRNGADTMLGSLSVPAGPVSQLRLVLGSNNSVVVDGVSFPLQTPSAQQSGLKLLVNTTLSAGINYHFTMDFDGARSIVKTGNGNYILKPVIRIFTESTTGAIKGLVDPAASKAWVYAIANQADTLATTQADTLTGRFLLQGIAAGSAYKVAIHAAAGGYKDTTLTNITVTNGATTDIGKISLQ